MLGYLNKQLEIEAVIPVRQRKKWRTSLDVLCLLDAMTNCQVYGNDVINYYGAFSIDVLIFDAVKRKKQ
jgi:hypothetical protein